MKLLEDKSVISEMNALSEEDQRKLVLSHAKMEDCEIYYGMIKKKQKDSKNFHILTDRGVLLQRQEFSEFMKTKNKIVWSVVGKNTKRIYGDFGTVIDTFNKMI